MASQFTPSDLGFSDFVGKLIAEIFDSVISSQLDQQKHHLETAAALDWSDEEFARAYLDERLLDQELANLFPTTQTGRIHAVYEYGPYRPIEAEGGEQPPFSRLLGLALEADLEYAAHPNGQGWIILAAGVDRIRTVVGKLLAARLRAGLREIYRRGAPRVVVDSGKMQAKLAYLVKSEPVEQQATQTLGAKGRRTFANPSGAPGNTPISALRLAVRQADERTVRNEFQAGLYGEVSINFRTVT